MTALDLCPEYVRVRVLTGKYPDDYMRAVPLASKGIREDLAIIPAAEADGWIVTFRDDNWRNSASFTRGPVEVWSAVHHEGNRGRVAWRAADMIDGRMVNHRWHLGSLSDALAVEARAGRSAT